MYGASEQASFNAQEKLEMNRQCVSVVNLSTDLKLCLDLYHVMETIMCFTWFDIPT